MLERLCEDNGTAQPRFEISGEDDILTGSAVQSGASDLPQQPLEDDTMSLVEGSDGKAPIITFGSQEAAALGRAPTAANLDTASKARSHSGVLVGALKQQGAAKA